MAKNMGAIYPSFLDDQPEIVQKVKCAMSSYVNAIAGSIAGNTTGQGTTTTLDLRPELQVNINADGWPVLRHTQWEDLSKHNLEHIVRRYLSIQYSKPAIFASFGRQCSYCKQNWPQVIDLIRFRLESLPKTHPSL